MKDKRNVIDLFQDLDDKTAEKLAENYPQFPASRADRIYKQIERRIGTADDDFSGIEVSGVEKYRPSVLRRVVSVAACAAVVAAGTGTVFALRHSSENAPDKPYAGAYVTSGTIASDEPTSQLTKEVNTTDENTANSELNSDASYTRSPVPDVITQEWLLELCSEPEKNFRKCYIETMEINGQGLCIKACDYENGILYSHYEDSYITDYAYNGKRISLWNPPDASPDIVENPIENMKDFTYNGWLDDFNMWSIEGTEEYLGRQCAVISLSAAYDDTGKKHEPFAYIDLETGILLKTGKYIGDSVEYILETIKFCVDDEATMIPTPQDIKKMIADGGYTPEEGLDLSFLSGDTASTSAASSVTPKATEPITETIPPPTSGISDEPAAQTDIFTMLDALDYHAISCDGLPTHKLTAPDGTVYLLHLDDAYSYVWRRPSLIADQDNEAPLTQEVISALYVNWNELDIEKYEY